MIQKKIMIFASLMCADQLHLADEIKELEDAGIDGFHLDIMDGLFVSNFTLGFPAIQAIRPVTSLPIHAHLMIKEPGKYIQRFADEGADIISFHYESTSNFEETLKGLDSSGAKKAIAINPETDIKKIYPYLSILDIVLIMSVHPGFAGGKFLLDSPERIKELAGERKKKDLKFKIEADGNINTDTVPLLYRAGAGIFVGGSTGVFIKGKKFSTAISDLRRSCI